MSIYFFSVGGKEVALAAAKHGMKALICIPDGAPISKVEATKRYGADVCLVKGVYDDAYQKACELQQESGSTFIHPFNGEDVIATLYFIFIGDSLQALRKLSLLLIPRVFPPRQPLRCLLYTSIREYRR